MSEFSESNRNVHFKYAIPAGALFTIIFVAGLAAGMEFKDVHHDNGNKPIREWDWKCWDWKDFKWTIYGGIVGQIIQLLIIGLIIIIFF